MNIIKPRKATILLLCILLTSLLAVGYGVYNLYSQPHIYTARVLSVIDGDTILLENGEFVRLIGIDSPEKGNEYYYEAKGYLESLVVHRNVILERDIENKDTYGRLLRYVYVEGLFVNAEMIIHGFATSYPYPPNIKYVELFDSYESWARRYGVGMFPDVLPDFMKGFRWAYP